MNNLSKREKVIAIAVVAVLACAGLWFFLIRSQQSRLSQAAKQVAEAQAKVDQAKALIRSSDAVSKSLEEVSERLRKVEAGMASGDLYTWALNNITRFTGGYKLGRPYLTRPGTNEVGVLPEFPYLGTTISLNTAGNFEDIGRFVADFENEFPYFLITRLSLEPASTATERDEQLKLTMDILALVKPDTSR